MVLSFSYHEVIDSTNSEILRLMRTGIPEGAVVSAGQQTAGKGRSGHSWESPSGDSVATSIALYPAGLSDIVLPRLTIIAAVAVAEAVEELYDLPTQIKWPNDILVGGKKICGILTERMTEKMPMAAGGVPVIVGIGVNVHQHSFSHEIAHMATSLDLELAGCGRDATKTSRKDVTESIWQHFAAHYEKFVAGGGSLEDILDMYNSRLVSVGELVRVLDPAGEYEGKCIRMDEVGRLELMTDLGLRSIDSGEVSVRGIYGYV